MNKLEDIKETIVKNYRKNIEIKDVKFNEGGIWDSVTVAIVDNNKKYFKYKILSNVFFYDDEKKLKYYVENLIRDYILSMSWDKIRKAHTSEVIEEYKKEMLGDK